MHEHLFVASPWSRQCAGAHGYPCRLGAAVCICGITVVDSIAAGYSVPGYYHLHLNVELWRANALVEIRDVFIESTALSAGLVQTESTVRFNDVLPAGIHQYELRMKLLHYQNIASDIRVGSPGYRPVRDPSYSTVL